MLKKLFQDKQARVLGVCNTRIAEEQAKKISALVLKLAELENRIDRLEEGKSWVQ